MRVQRIIQIQKVYYVYMRVISNSNSYNILYRQVFPWLDICFGTEPIYVEVTLKSVAPDSISTNTPTP